MPKFVLTVPRYQQDQSCPQVRISQEAYTVLSEMCAKTGWPMARILSKAVFFAANALRKEVNKIALLIDELTDKINKLYQERGHNYGNQET